MKGENPLVEQLYNALHSPRGVILRTEGKQQSLVASITRVRKELADPQLDTLTISPSPTDPQEVWIMHKEPQSES